MFVAACSPGCDTSDPVVKRGTRSWAGISKREAHHFAFTCIVAHPLLSEMSYSRMTALHTRKRMLSGQCLPAMSTDHGMF